MLTPVLHLFLEAVRSCAAVVGLSAAGLGLWLVGLLCLLIVALVLGSRPRSRLTRRGWR